MFKKAIILNFLFLFIFNYSYNQESLSSNPIKVYSEQEFIKSLFDYFSDCIVSVKKNKFYIDYHQIILSERGIYLYSQNGKSLPLTEISSDAQGYFITLKMVDETAITIKCSHCGRVFITHPIVRQCPQCGTVN